MDRLRYWLRRLRSPASRGIMKTWTGSPVLPIARSPMHDDTMAAIKHLAQCLADHPEDLETANAYGSIPEHLADLIEDHEGP